MKKYPTNGWFAASEFIRAATAVHTAAVNEHIRWLGHNGVKYLQFRIDQRTGDFIILDRNGDVLDDALLYGMFPELLD